MRGIRIVSVCVATTGCLLLAGAAPGSAATPATPYTVEKSASPDPQSGGRWGERLVTAGDLTGDGVSDIWVALPFMDVGGVANAGRVYLLSGRDRSVVGVIDSPEPQTNASFGFYISAFGDANGDGKLDLAVGTDAQDVFTGIGPACGQPEPNGCNEDQGRAWVFNGATRTVIRTLDNPFPQGRANNSARFGSRIGSAGDVTGDGRADVIVGASNNDVPAVAGIACGDITPFPPICRKNQGQAFIFNAATGALVRTLDMPDTNRPTAPCGAPAGQPATGCGTFGLAVQSPGDATGDGVPDQLVDSGNYNFDTTGTGSACKQPPDPEPNGCNEGQGRMYLFSGATGALVHRIDDPTPQAGATFGFQDAAPNSPGDVNNDGRADLYANGFGQNGPGGAAAGRAWVFSGASGALLYEVLDPSPEAGGQFGWSMARTDYDKDGRPDLYVGSSPHHEPGATGTGGTYVYKGSDGTLLKPFELPAADLQNSVPGNNGPNLGWGLAAPGDLNGDGEPDYLGGAPFLDVASNQDQGAVYAFLSNVQKAQTPTYPRPYVFPRFPFPFEGCAGSAANVILGTNGHDVRNGTVAADRIFVGGGNDRVDGLAGDDCIDLGPGTDRGQGGAGNDLILGGLGADRLSGSSGNDRLRGNPGNDRISAGRGNDRAFGDSGNDSISGSFGNDRIHGVGGRDRISGSRGRDRINGGAGNDRISGGSSGDVIRSDQGNDRINGNSGNDRIHGNSGNDRITGSTGADRIAAGLGNDRINSRDGRRDRVNCGRGRDVLIADRFDIIARNCERSRRR